MLKKMVVGFFLFCPAYLAYADSSDEASARIFEVQMKLAQKHEPAAQFHVGEMYEKGLGTVQDLEQAHAWYSKSAAQGNVLAKDKLANWERIKQEIANAKDDSVRAKTIAQGMAATEARAKQQAQEKERAAAEARAKQQAQEKERAAAEARAKQQAQEKERAAAEARAKQQAQEKERTVQGAQATPVSPAPAAAATTPDAEPAKASAKTPTPEGKGDDAAFTANPCKGPSAAFLSTCK